MDVIDQKHRTALHRPFGSLGLRIVFPVLAVMALLGVGLYVLVLRSVSDFAEQRIKEDLERNSRQVYNLCDTALQNLLISGSVNNAVVTNITRGRTLGTIEEYLQQNNLKAIIYLDNGKKIFLSREFSEDSEKIISRLMKEKDLQSISISNKTYYVRQFQFQIWKWNIILAKDGEVYKELINEVRYAYMGTGVVLLVASLLLVYHLRRVVQNPIRSILNSILLRRNPEYKGINEFEFLSDSIREAAEKQKQEQAKILYQATHDTLTGLINRVEFERRLESVIQNTLTPNKRHTLLYLDLDQFKIVNDTSGHTAGDELLRQLTNVLQNKLRQNDILARLGGDEFGVLLESCPLEPATRIANLLRQAIYDFHFMWQDKSFSVGVSIGLVNFGNEGLTAEDIFRIADGACYIAKDTGRNCVHISNPGDSDLILRQKEMSWVGRIKKALEENRFVLYAQYIVPVRNTQNEGKHYEILLRMIDEKNNLIPPAVFIPAAERYDMMPTLDRWVIETAFAYCEKAYASKMLETCAINLSGTSIGDESLLVFIQKQFERFHFPPGLICFEITETSAISNLNKAINFIGSLKAMGCYFALDDFGSGMSSYGYLKQLPIDYLKIDGSFVKNIVNNPVDRAMVESINHIGHVMGIKTIAEFVENEDILKQLQKIGVDFAQGYGIDRPHPLPQIN